MFKKGDNVRIIDNERLDSHQRKYVGKIGIVDESFSKNPYVKLPDGRRLPFNSDKLKLVNSPKEMLKTGSLVLIDNIWYVAILDGIPDAVTGDANVLIRYDNQDSCLSLKYFDDELNYYFNVGLYAQKILQPNCSKHAFAHMCKGTPVESADHLLFDVIWERENPQISKLEKVISDLKEQLQKAEKELSAIKEG